LILPFCAFAQNQKFADSLELVYNAREYEQNKKLWILFELSFNHTDVEKKLTFANELLNLAQQQDSISYFYKGYYLKGNALRLKGDLSEALESYFEGAKYAMQEDINLGDVYMAIADVYSIIGNSNNSVNYYKKAIENNRLKNDSMKIASSLLNAGDEYFNIGQLDTARQFTEEAGKIFQQLNYFLGEAYALGNIGMMDAEMGNDITAEKNMNEAIRIMEGLEDFYPIAVYLTYISDIYQNKGNNEKAVSYAKKSLDIATSNGLKKQIGDAHFKLFELFEKAGEADKSLFHYKEYIASRDSINNLNEIQTMADLRTDFEVSQKQREVDLLNQVKRNQKIINISILIILGLITILLLTLYQFYQSIKKAKKRSDKLLLNILPTETAEELKETGKVKAKRFESVTVLFSDFKDFTKYSEDLPPEELVKQIDFYFSKFDQIIEKYGLEKIKTIGDAYMCAGGLPNPTEQHAKKMVSAALDITAFLQKENAKTGKENAIDLRIGINTGPVVAGVVGLKKFAYDIWGDTVNIASRMESTSEAGKINISEDTYDLIKDDFECEFRGEIDAKNKGKMKMYFVIKKWESGNLFIR
jgi:class 3 adenylate cyclase